MLIPLHADSFGFWSVRRIGFRCDGRQLKIVGLFAGIGGLERGLEQSGHQTELLCEIDPAAQRVLRSHFANVTLMDDVRSLRSLPNCDLVVGGFPCQDLSQAGSTAGIRGKRSGLVSEVFRLLMSAGNKGPKWLLLENVPFMLHLDRGKAMAYLTDTLSERGYAWAYRVIDSRAFGLPQRRRRVVLLASREGDPRQALFADNARESKGIADWTQVACGFYWTEGKRGLGWAVDAIPPLKGGSTIGIPSPPAIWFPLEGRVGTPDIRDAERMQGFPVDWTTPAVEKSVRNGPRWRLVGNAVSVPLAKWIGKRLSVPGSYNRPERRLAPGERWPMAAWGTRQEAFLVETSTWPVRFQCKHLHEFCDTSHVHSRRGLQMAFCDALTPASFTLWTVFWKTWRHMLGA